jgi:hypothetical protein
MGRCTRTVLHSHARHERWSTAPYLGHASPSIPALRPRRGGDPHRPKSLCLHRDKIRLDQSHQLEDTKNRDTRLSKLRSSAPRRDTRPARGHTAREISTNTCTIQRARRNGADRHNAERGNERDSPVGERGAASACGEGGGGGAQRGAICGGHRIHPNGGWGEVAGRS